MDKPLSACYTGGDAKVLCNIEICIDDTKVPGFCRKKTYLVQGVSQS